MKKEYQTILFKTLSRNDTGETKSHQSGISIPKNVATSNIFPPLSKDILNHRKKMFFHDEDGNQWEFEYVYYNDKYHGKESGRCHDEYRLTCVTKFIRENKAKSGDQVWFGRDSKGELYIGISKSIQDIAPASSHIPSYYYTDDIVDEFAAQDIQILDPREHTKPVVIKLSKNWSKLEYNK